MRIVVILAIAILAALVLQPPALLAGSPISPPPRPLSPPARSGPPAAPAQREAKRERGPAVILLRYAPVEDTAPALVGQGAGR